MHKVEKVYYYPVARRFIAEMVAQHNPLFPDPDDVERRMVEFGENLLIGAASRTDGNYYGGTIGFHIEVDIDAGGNAYFSYSLEGNIIKAGLDSR